MAGVGNFQPGSAAHEEMISEAIAEFGPQWGPIMREQREHFCAQFPPGQCPDPIDISRTWSTTVTGLVENPGEWNETWRDVGGQVDWQKTIQARLKNSPGLYIGGALLAVAVLRGAK